jgi:hypothetical protein
MAPNDAPTPIGIVLPPIGRLFPEEMTVSIRGTADYSS